jgi:CheY-like chemotaxis protein
MIAKRLRPYAADIVFGLFACAFFVWLTGAHARDTGGRTRQRPGVLAARPAHRRGQPAQREAGRARSALAHWLAAAGRRGAVALAERQHLVATDTPGAANSQPDWIQWIEIFQHVLVLAAFFAFPNKPVSRDARLRFFADVGLTTVAGRPARGQGHLLLTDMIMPWLDGRQVAAGFRAARPGVPVVGITGFAGESDQDAVFDKAGLAGLVTKPFSAEALIRAVASACEGR